MRKFQITDIEVDATRAPYVFPAELTFAASGQFTGSVTPLCPMDSNGKMKHCK